VEHAVTDTIDVESARFIGAGLNRPECVLATKNGHLYTADWRGGVAEIAPNGSVTLYKGATADLPEGLRPNGIALEKDGSFLFANLGSELGGIFRLTRNGQVSPLICEVDGVALPPSNFVVRDNLGRLWATVSTRLQPRALDYRRAAKTGFVVMDDGKGPRIVADALGFTNECLVDPSGQYLYVNETYARRMSRFALKPNGDLGPKEVVVEFGRGQFPDGLAFDVEGNAWIAGIISNQLIRVTPTGKMDIVLEDSDAAHVAWIEEAYAAEKLGPPHMGKIVSRRLRNISSLAFGGADLRTGYLGCLLGDSVAAVRMPVAGVPPVHWMY
jgi:sugar lactone lactonase YvrE